MKSDSYYKLLLQCEGIEGRTTSWQDSRGITRSQKCLYKVGEVKVPPGIFIEIISTSVKGSVGRLIGIDVNEWDNNRVVTHGGTLHLEFDGRPKPSKKPARHCELLLDYKGPATVWCKPQPASKKPMEEFKPHVNKYNQTINKGDWITGLGRKKVIFGKVTRWSHASVWVTTDTESKTGKEYCITNPYDSFVLPSIDDDIYEKHIMMTVLQGWDGSQA